MDIMDITFGSDDKFIKTLDGYAAEKIRTAILSGKLVPGEKIDESALANGLKISRTPIRAALRILASEGLVTMNPHRRVIVTEMTREEFKELYLIRGALESLAAVVAIPRLTDDHIKELQELLRIAENETDLVKWMEYNRSFHMKMYELSEMPQLLNLIGVMFNMAVPYCLKFMAIPKYFTESRQGHLKIIKACEERDGHKVAKEIQEHLMIGFECLVD